MKLLTKEIIAKLPKLYSQENESDPICQLKYFTPDGDFTWYITEGEKQADGDWLFFGKVVGGMCPDGELGYTALSQIKMVKGSLGLPVERDRWFDSKPLSQCK